ncbi:MAG TPA: M15 family metallopeptidase [Gammaproteobacteria bacterium]|nr:M15 family metallopeptidase [Gammaproteobacteria bacterium]
MALPTGFVYLKEVDASIIQDVRYFTTNNFIGRPIKGYEAAECILTREAAQALSQLQQQLLPQHLSLKVYDCYRPQTAVDDFIAWSEDENDQKMKEEYYPNVNKADFFALGYVAAKSGHTRGSTVDLTIVHLPVNDGKPKEMAMGTHFDFMDELSHALSPKIHGKEKDNRLFLRSMMQKAGFEPYEKEWWHFTLKDEPYPDTYFNFPIA